MSYYEAYCVVYLFICCRSYFTVCSDIRQMHDIARSFKWGLLIGIYLYILIEDKTTLLWKTLLFYIFEETLLRHEILPFYLFCFHFHLEVTWLCHVIHLLYRWLQPQSIKSRLLFRYVNRNNIFVKTIYFISWLMFYLLAVIYKCFSFRVFCCLCPEKLTNWSLIIILCDIRISATVVKKIRKIYAFIRSLWPNRIYIVLLKISLYIMRASASLMT